MSVTVDLNIVKLEPKEERDVHLIPTQHLVVNHDVIKEEIRDIKEEIQDESCNTDINSHVGDVSITPEETDSNYVNRNNAQIKHSKKKNNRMYKCKKCDYITKWKSNLTQHDVKHSSIYYNCPKCEYITNAKHNLKSHIEKHSGTYYNCAECKYTTTTKSYLQRHIQTHTNILNCDLCNYTTKWRSNLSRHKSNHSNVYYYCDKCTYKTNTEDYLQKHLQAHLNIFKCDQCDYTTKWKYQLKPHQLKHSGAFYYCDNCDYKTNLKQNLIHHVQIHLTIFKCNHCDYITARWERGLKKHPVIQSEGSYYCDKCEYNTKIKRILQKHIQTHLDVFKCGQCGTSGREYSLQRHELKHSDIYYSCNQCKYKTKRINSLKQHVLNHSDTYIKQDKC